MFNLQPPLLLQSHFLFEAGESFRFFSISAYPRHLFSRERKRRDYSKRPSSKAASREEGEAYRGYVEPSEQ